MKSSQNGKFALDENIPYVLYSVTNTPPHPWLSVPREIATPRMIKNVPYYPFAYTGTLKVNDCLGFAESMASGIEDYNERASVFREKGSGLKFGVSDTTNTELANGKRGSIVLNNRANPEIGEAYAIVRTAIPKKGQVPFHIGYVFAKDGNTNITLEANASDKSLTKPIFDMYSLDDTWHDRYTPLYRPAATIVLKKA